MTSSMNSARASQSRSAIRPNTAGERGSSSSTKPQTLARWRGSLRSAWAMERAIGPPPMMRTLRSSVSAVPPLPYNCRNQRHSTRPARLLANIAKAARGRISSHAAMKTSAIANRVDRASAGTTRSGRRIPGVSVESLREAEERYQNRKNRQTSPRQAPSGREQR